MPRKAFLCRKAFIVTVSALGVSAALPGALSPFAATGVEAATSGRVYTRKKVNGRWITGRFTDGNVRARYASLPPAPAAVTTLPPIRPDADRRSQADRVIATASMAPVSPEPRLETMRPALEARARALAGEPLALPLPDAPPPLPELLVSR